MNYHEIAMNDHKEIFWNIKSKPPPILNFYMRTRSQIKEYIIIFFLLKK